MCLPRACTHGKTPLQSTDETEDDCAVVEQHVLSDAVAMLAH